MKLKLFLLMAFPYAVHAQQISTLTLDEIVVTGTKSDKGLKDGPVKTEVLQEKLIKENHYKDMAEAIAEIPGVTLSNSDGKLGQTAIIQGLGREHVLVLIDGSPVMQSSVSGFDLGQISTSNILRIEVIKGGASSLYGAQAMGGVINIITKKPVGETKYEVDVSRDEVSGKTLKDTGYNSAKGSLAGAQNNTSYRFQLSHNQSSSVELDNSSFTRDTPDLSKFNGGVWLEQTSNNKNHSLALDYNHYFENNTSYRAKIQPDLQYKSVINEGDIRGHRLAVTEKSEFENFKITSTVLGEKISDKLIMEHDPKFNYIEMLKTSELRRIRGESQIDFSPHEDHMSTVGFVFDKNFLDQTSDTSPGNGTIISFKDVDKKSNYNIDTYVQDDWIIKDFEVITGARYSHDGSFGGNISPKLNLSYSPVLFDGTTSVVRASYGSGFRSPNLKERFYVLDHRAFGYVVQGNENLASEKSHSYQLGIEVDQNKKFGVNANLFYNNVDNLIITKEIPSGSNEILFQYMNIGKAEIKGFELGAHYAILDDYTVSHSFTHTDARDADTGLVIANRPFYIAQSSLTYENPNKLFSVIYNFKYFGDSYATNDNTEKFSKYMQSDLKFNYAMTKESALYLGAKNIFNVKKDPLSDVATPVYDQRPSFGKTFFVGLRIEG